MRRITWALKESIGPLMAWVFLCLAGSGCSGPLQGTATPTRFYLLQSEAPLVEGFVSDSQPVFEGTLGIGPVGLPEYLKRPQVVTRDGSRKIKLSLFDHWGEPLDAGIVRVLSTALVGHQGIHHLSIQPRTFHDTLDYRLWIDINRFDGSPGGELVLAGRWSVRGSAREVPAGWHDFFLRQTVIGDNIEALVAAHSTVLERLAADVAVVLGRRFAG